MRLILRWILNAGVLLLLPTLFQGVQIDGWYAALMSVLILGLVNTFIRPIITAIVKIITLPVNVITLGLLGLVITLLINAGLFWFVSTFIEGFAVDSFVTALLASFVMSVCSSFIGFFLKKHR